MHIRFGICVFHEKQLKYRHKHVIVDSTVNPARKSDTVYSLLKAVCAKILHQIPRFYGCHWDLEQQMLCFNYVFVQSFRNFVLQPLVPMGRFFLRGAIILGQFANLLRALLFGTALLIGIL